MKILVFGAGVLGCNLARKGRHAAGAGSMGREHPKKRPSDQG